MEVPLTKFEVKEYRNDVVNYYTVSGNSKIIWHPKNLKRYLKKKSEVAYLKGL